MRRFLMVLNGLYKQNIYLNYNTIMAVHHFDTEVAKVVGIEKAVILSHINFWIEKNEADNTNFIDGRYWTFSTVKGFHKLFPYMTPKTIRRCLLQLEEDDYLTSSHLSDNPTNRTKWYSLNPAFYAICPYGQLEVPERANVYKEEDRSIEDKESKPSEKKSLGSLPLDELIVANEKRLRHLPKSVSKKPVTLEEANWVLVSMKMFNDVRAHRLGKLDDPTYRWLTPDLKACRQLVTLFRDDPKISDSWYATIENMFNEGYHQDNKWQYLTPEFVSRKAKYDIYYNAGA